MLFNSIEFIIFLITVVISLGIVKNGKFQYIFLLVGSYFFFYFSSNYLVILLIYSTLIDFFIAKRIASTRDKFHKKILLIGSLVGNLSILGFFKYYDFAVMQLNWFGDKINLLDEFTILNVILPVGISFYTFQTISYTIDVYRGKLIPSKSFSEFALFVAFFPQLVAGPILRAQQFLPQLREKLLKKSNAFGLKSISESSFRIGVTLIIFGLFKKMFIADNLSPFVDEIFSNPIGLESYQIISATIAFGIQIYCDFSGYSDIAIGTAAILGLKIPPNFIKPYFATSPVNFWHRWHISLSTWLRDYLYIPLGGNKKSKHRTYVNLLLVMFLGGLWHGASWNFVLWGIIHGTYLSIQKIIGDKFPYLKNSYFFKSKIGKIIGIVFTQYIVFLAWIPFRVSNFEYMMYAMEKYFFIDFIFDNFSHFIFSHKVPFIIIGIFVLIQIISIKQKNILDYVIKLKVIQWSIILLLLILTILFFYNGNNESFIYFKF